MREATGALAFVLIAALAWALWRYARDD